MQYNSQAQTMTQTQSKISSATLGWFIWGMAALFYFYEYLLQVSPGVMVPELMKAFSVNATALGNLTAFYFYAYAAMQIPVGVLIDRFGPRKLLTAGSVICVLGAFFFGTAVSLHTAQLGRFLIGIGGAFAVIGTFKLAANWFPADRFAFVTGVTVMIGMLGAIFGQTPLALLVHAIEWRASMVLLAAIGAGLAILIWLKTRDHPPVPLDLSNIIVEPEQKNLLSGLRIVLTKKQNWIVACYAGLMFGPVSIFGSLWGVPFLVQTYDLTRSAAAALISMMFIGVAVGSPLICWYSDHIGKRRPPMFISSIGCLISLLCLLYIPHLPYFFLAFFLAAFGFFAIGFLPSFSVIREINAPDVTATALGYMNMLNMVGGALGQPLVGWVLDRFWDGRMEDGVRIYSTMDFHISLAILPLCTIVSLILLPFIKETYCGKPQTAK